jgi:hypothetical protein
VAAQLAAFQEELSNVSKKVYVFSTTMEPKCFLLGKERILKILFRFCCISVSHGGDYVNMTSWDV